MFIGVVAVAPPASGISSATKPPQHTRQATTSPAVASVAVATDTALAPLRALLVLPEAEVDFAKAKLAIDRLIAPGIDVNATLKSLDAMAGQVRVTIPPGANRRTALVALMTYLYKSGSWNDGRPFSYDLDDPFGRNLRNKLLTTYLTTRKGNCVSMPILFVILAQKVGLEASLSTAPNHMFAKIRDDDGQVLNIENTSGGTKSVASYQRDFAITDQAIQSGIYLQSLTRRESIVVMMDTLMEFYGQQGEQQLRIATAQLALSAYPKDVGAMLHQASAYQRIMKQRYLDRYASFAQMTRDQIENYQRLGQAVEHWGGQAEELGWRQNAPGQDAAYQEKMKRVKAVQEEMQ